MSFFRTSTVLIWIDPLFFLSKFYFLKIIVLLTYETKNRYKPGDIPSLHSPQIFRKAKLVNPLPLRISELCWKAKKERFRNSSFTIFPQKHKTPQISLDHPPFLVTVNKRQTGLYTNLDEMITFWTFCCWKYINRTRIHSHLFTRKDCANDGANLIDF